MRRAGIFALFLCPFAGTSHAQLVDVLRVTVSPDKMAANGAGPQAPHWRLAALPAAGDILLTGALGPMVRLNGGDHVVARIGGVGTASFSYQD